MRRTLFSTSITIMHVPCHEANLGDSRTSPLDSTTLAPALLLSLPFLWVLLPETIASFYRKGTEREEKRYHKWVKSEKRYLSQVIQTNINGHKSC